MARGDIATEFNRVFSDCADSGVCSLDEIAKEIYQNIDIFEWNREELVLEHIKGIATTMLNRLGWRSVIPSKGVFADPENCRLDYLIQMLNIEAARVEMEEKSFKKLREITRAKTKETPGQLTWDFTQNRAVQEKTAEELYQMLLADLGVEYGT